MTEWTPEHRRGALNAMAIGFLMGVGLSAILTLIAIGVMGAG